MSLIKKMPHDVAAEKPAIKYGKIEKEMPREIFPNFIPTSKNNAYFYT